MALRCVLYCLVKCRAISLSLLLASGSFLLFAKAFAAEKITALVYDFPPYYTDLGKGQYSGIGIDMLSIMSTVQDKYEFSYVGSSPRRRHDHFYIKDIDISIFDQMSWGWDQEKVDASKIYMGGGERYIALKEEGVDQSVFSNLQEHRLAAILGYHYSFASFESDPEFLREKYHIQLVGTQDQIIKMVSSKRVEVGVVTEAYLLGYFKKHNELKDKLIVSDIYDQPYNFVGVRNKKSKLSLKELNQIIAKTIRSPAYQSLLTQYGLQN